MWLKADNIKCTHGFSNRHGGVSGGAFASLNLGGSEDAPENISTNRQRALKELGLDSGSLCLLRQVHGCEVLTARPGLQEGDAFVTDQKNLALVISVADCYPIIFHDPVNGVIGAAHAGWRGTVGGITSNTITMMKELGAQPEEIRVAIGPGISCENFPVGHDVLEQFRAKEFSPSCFAGNKVDLLKCNTELLQRAGIPSKNIFALNRCTTHPDFFSYRRDSGVTGRMWGLISMS
jgi:polyphenol oxidase